MDDKSLGIFQARTMGEPQWYINVKGKEHGPFPLARLKRTVESGGLPESATVWRDGWQDWKPWQEVPILNGSANSDDGDAAVEFAAWSREQTSATSTRPAAADVPASRAQQAGPQPAGMSSQSTVHTHEGRLSLGDMTMLDLGLRVLGLLLVIGGVFWFGAMLGQGYGQRFKDDNAIGATANAVEIIKMNVIMWCHIFGGLALYAYSSLRRIRQRVLARL